MNVSINVKEKNIGNQVKKTSKNKLPSYLFLKKILQNPIKNKIQNSKKTLKLLKLIFCSPAQMNGKVNFDRFYVMILLQKGPQHHVL